MAGTISSEEINYLIYRYLQESGFVHSAFTFAYESLVSKSVVTQSGSQVPPGTLIAFLQKGLQLVSMEQQLNEDGSERRIIGGDDLISTDMSTEFSLLSPHICQAARGKNPMTSEVTKAQFVKVGIMRKADEQESDIDHRQIDRLLSPSPNASTSSGYDPPEKKAKLPSSCEVGKSSVFALMSHTSEVFCCAWNPQQPGILATGSGDATARIWTVEECGGEVGSSESLTLVHAEPPQTVSSTTHSKRIDSVSDTIEEDEQNSHVDRTTNLMHMEEYTVKNGDFCVNTTERDVTTLEWSRDGSLLATGMEY